MMKRVPLVALLLAAAAGLAMLAAVQSGWANYLWDRYSYGGSVQVAGRCLAIPSQWTVVPGGSKGIVDVRRHFVASGPEVLASVLPARMVAGVRDVTAAPSAVGGGFAVYDLGPASQGAPLGYVAINEEWSIAVTAARSELLAELATALSACGK